MSSVAERGRRSVTTTFVLIPQRKVAADRLGLAVDEVPGGHLVALSRPVEPADRLEGYLRST